MDPAACYFEFRKAIESDDHKTARQKAATKILSALELPIERPRLAVGA